MLQPWVLAMASLALATNRGLGTMRNLVTFGDSYSDESRIAYFVDHNGHPPPAGTLLPPNNVTASGGHVWGRFVANMTGAAFYDYAVSGATCSNDIVNRYLPQINASFPSVLEYEVPAFQADTAFKTLYPDRRGDNTVYTLWIGTNDLGNQGFLTDSNIEGTTITSFIECVWKVFDGIYEAGGRHFVLLNEAPLQFSPMYAAPGIGGAGDNSYWANKTSYNTTEYQYKMLEQTTSVNTLFDYGVPFNLVVKKRWPGATFAIFDVHSLLLDIRANPGQYLTKPANATGSYRSCGKDGKCVNSEEPGSSFLWFDELHPSERTDEIIAGNFVDVVRGDSKYATYYSQHGRL